MMTEKENIAPDENEESNVTNVTKDEFLGNILIEDLRSEHIGKIISIKGILTNYSRVFPKTVKIKFECPSCGTILSVYQVGEKRQEPKRCSCGRRGGFKELSKDQVDFQVLNVEENPDNVEPGRIKRSITVFLENVLTQTELEKTLKLRKNIHVIGKLIESESEGNVGSYMIEAQNFTIGTQFGDRELKNYLMDNFFIDGNKAEFLVILKNNFYNLTKSCIKCGIARKTHYRWLEETAYKEALDFINEDKREFLESEIVKKIKYGDDRVSADMLKFYAKSKLGYIETTKQLNEHSGEIKNQGIVVNLLPDPEYERKKEERNQLSSHKSEEGAEEVRKPDMSDKEETHNPS